MQMWPQPLLGVVHIDQLLRVSDAAKFEEEIFPKNDIPFFGRYIDDVLCIVYADSIDEAIRKASVVKYPGLEIEWSASDKNLPFLDMFVYIDPSDRRRPQHKPYRKAQPFRTHTLGICSPPRRKERNVCRGDVPFSHT
jgi:hypothetical protein